MKIQFRVSGFRYGCSGSGTGAGNETGVGGDDIASGCPGGAAPLAALEDARIRPLENSVNY